MVGASTYIDPSSPVVAAHLDQIRWIALLLVAALAAAIFAVSRLSRGLATSSVATEDAGLRLLRLGGALLWFFTGLTALRLSTVLGVGARALPESLAGSPAWLRSVAGGTADRWLAHGTWSATAVALLGLGMGAWLAVAGPGRPLRLAGGSSAVLAASWWVASGLGGLLGNGGWASGAGGAAPWLGLLGLALAAGPLHAARLRLGAGAALIVLGLLQALGLRSAWVAGPANPVSMAAARAADATTWNWLAGRLRWSASSAAQHAATWNVVVVVVLVLVGLTLCLGGPRLRLLAAGVYACSALAAWILVTGCSATPVYGVGLGALPASALVVVAAAMVPGRAMAVLVLPRGLARVVASLGVAAVLVGSGLSVLVALRPGADGDLALATGLSAAPLPRGEPPRIAMLRLNGEPFSLADLRGRVVVATFIDPICDTDCAALAREVDAAVARSGAKAVALGINLNPRHTSAESMERFARREGLSTPPWLLLTGSPAQVRATAKAWRESWAQPQGGGMLMHDDPVYVLDPAGRIATAWEAPPDEGGGVAARSAVAAIAQAIRDAGGR